MNLKDDKLLEFLAYEAFLRRAAEVDLPFMLKGSFVTRQYFENPNDRIPNDLDWVYLFHLENSETAEHIFNEWATVVTEMKMDDGVKFRSFQENAFWRMIDYAMSDDFPTVNTDLMCLVGEKNVDYLELDISFNLPIENPPVPLLYTPLQGEPFVIPKTVPISSQIAWKLHQTIVRPRFKDIFDLIHLLKHESFNEETLQNCLQTLINECFADNVDINNLKFLMDGDLDTFFPKNSIEKNWKYWRYYYESFSQGLLNYEKAENITDTSNLTTDLQEFKNNFSQAMAQAGFINEIMDKLPQPTIKKKLTPSIESKEEPTEQSSFFDSLKNFFGF